MTEAGWPPALQHSCCPASSATLVGLLVLFSFTLGTPAHAPSSQVGEGEEKTIVVRDKIILYENASGYRTAANTDPEAGDLLIVPCRLKKTESIVVAAYLYFGPDTKTMVFNNLEPAPAVPSLYRSEYPDLIGTAKADSTYAVPEHDRQESPIRVLSVFLPYSQIDGKVASRSAFFSYRMLVFRRTGNGSRSWRT